MQGPIKRHGRNVHEVRRHPSGDHLTSKRKHHPVVGTPSPSPKQLPSAQPLLSRFPRPSISVAHSRVSYHFSPSAFARPPNLRSATTVTPTPRPSFTSLHARHSHHLSHHHTVAMRPILHLLLPALALAADLGVDVTRPVDCVRKSKKGDKLVMNYKGTLQSDGTQFDSSYDRGKPFSFKLGAGQVIKGWDQGLLDMCPGEGRTLTIPPEFGYGYEDNGPIPSGSTLSMFFSCVVCV
jgi:hypothetical protein